MSTQFEDTIYFSPYSELTPPEAPGTSPEAPGGPAEDEDERGGEDADIDDSE